jgi:hypothetical protein
MEEFFVQSDLNKDGYLSIEDFKMWGDNLEKEVKAMLLSGRDSTSKVGGGAEKIYNDCKNHNIND